MLISPFISWVKFKAWCNPAVVTELLQYWAWLYFLTKWKKLEEKISLLHPRLEFCAVLGKACGPLWLELEVGSDRRSLHERIARTFTPVLAMGKSGCAGYPPVIKWILAPAESFAQNRINF